MKVIKFGGTSLDSAEGLQNVVEIVRSELDSGSAPVVVVSAFKNITDQLIDIANGQASGNLDHAMKVLKKSTYLH